MQLFSAERHELERYSNAINDAHGKEIEVGRTKAAFDGVVHVAANGAVLLVLGCGGKLVVDGQMSAGDLTGFLMYSLLMAGNISSLSGTYTEMMKSVAAAGRTGGSTIPPCRRFLRRRCSRPPRHHMARCGW